mgnify:CR=1 FL=1
MLVYAIIATPPVKHVQPKIHVLLVMMVFMFKILCFVSLVLMDVKLALVQHALNASRDII